MLPIAHILWTKCPDARPTFDGSADIRGTEPGTESVVEEALELGEWVVVEVNKGHDNEYSLCSIQVCSDGRSDERGVFLLTTIICFSRTPVAEESYFPCRIDQSAGLVRPDILIRPPEY